CAFFNAASELERITLSACIFLNTTLLPVCRVSNSPSNRSNICFCCSSIVSNLFSNSTTLVEPVYTSHLFSFGFQTEGAVSPAAFGNSLYFQSSLAIPLRSEEHTSELQSRFDLVCRLLLEQTKNHEL